MQEVFEKIIERLEELKTNMFKVGCCDGYECEDADEECSTCYLNRAIEIVNQVASEYGEEVCEWKEDMTLSRSAIGHGKFESLMYVCKWKYCPYCGKKIKVVE